MTEYNRFGQSARSCPVCGEPMVQLCTSVPPSRCFWVCITCDHEEEFGR